MFTPVQEVLSIRSNHLFLVGLEVAFEPLKLAITFKYQEMSTYSVKEEPIMADHHRASRKINQSLLKNSHCIDIKVICRLIKKEKVSSDT